jgi:hypothetical protein
MKLRKKPTGKDLNGFVEDPFLQENPERLFRQLAFISEVDVKWQLAVKPRIDPDKFLVSDRCLYSYVYGCYFFPFYVCQVSLVSLI